MNVTVYNMNVFGKSIYNDDTVDDYYDSRFICIHSNNWVHSLPHFDRPHNNVLNLNFDDVDVDCVKTVQWFNNTTKTITARKMTTKQAKQILDFVGNSTDIHVYCAKGKSRSTAVAKYLLDRKNIDSSHIVEYNHYVYNTLKEADVQD